MWFRIFLFKFPMCSSELRAIWPFPLLHYVFSKFTEKQSNKLQGIKLWFFASRHHELQLADIENHLFEKTKIRNFYLLYALPFTIAIDDVFYTKPIRNLQNVAEVSERFLGTSSFLSIGAFSLSIFRFIVSCVCVCACLLYAFRNPLMSDDAFTCFVLIPMGTFRNHIMKSNYTEYLKWNINIFREIDEKPLRLSSVQNIYVCVIALIDGWKKCIVGLRHTIHLPN